MKKILILIVAIGLAGCNLGKEDPLVEEVEVPVEIVETGTSVPIIMYHYVREVDQGTDPLGWNLSVTPDLFEKQLEYLRDEGYLGIHLSDLVDGKVPENAVVLTFDDGTLDFYTTALPLLEEYGFTASNSIIAEKVGDDWYMTDMDILSIVSIGIEITSHTLSHPDLTQLSEEEVRRQVAESRDFLENFFSVEINGFVYPAGEYNEMVMRVLAEEGYEVAVTTEYGEADLVGGEMLALPRIRIDNRDGFEGFVGKLEALK